MLLLPHEDLVRYIGIVCGCFTKDVAKRCVKRIGDLLTAGLRCLSGLPPYAEI